MYAMNIQNDVIGLVLCENCKSKQMTDIIAWPSRCHGRIYTIDKTKQKNEFSRFININSDIMSSNDWRLKVTFD